MVDDDTTDRTDQLGPQESDFALMRKLADASAIAICAGAAAAEHDEATLAVRHAIAQADAAQGLRGAVERAASRHALAMTALRLAVCEFTFAHRTEGLTPERVLIALKKLIDNRAMPPIAPHESDWNGDRLRECISTWCIKAYFDSEGACT